jgi:hypothetical protein
LLLAPTQYRPWVRACLNLIRQVGCVVCHWYARHQAASIPRPQQDQWWASCILPAWLWSTGDDDNYWVMHEAYLFGPGLGVFFLLLEPSAGGHKYVCRLTSINLHMHILLL